jgi:undecaprenyl-phosphate galactose phosphotransferase
MAVHRNHLIKRSVDVVLGLPLAMLSLPLMGLLALLIPLESRGWPFLLQTRIGYHNRDFFCLKFRTMQADGDRELETLLQKDAQLAEEWKKYAKLRSRDPRLTRLGRFLRRYSIDEIPQILNVLAGTMSLVGPRPYLPRERERIGDDLDTILEVRPGITGLWQVKGRNRLKLEHRAQLDVWYVQNWSFWLDFVILTKTIKIVLNGRDAS